MFILLNSLVSLMFADQSGNILCSVSSCFMLSFRNMFKVCFVSDWINLDW